MSNMMQLSEELTWRGFVNQTTYKDLQVLNGDSITFYWGVDPSADSMTIGNLAAAMMVKCFIKHGHKAVLLVGGATGLIGDPDGKSQERALKPVEEIAKNKQAIVDQYGKIFGEHSFVLQDNYDWFKGLEYLDFLRDIGKHVPMRQMLGRDFVQTRLGEDGVGISYAEFSYVLIQAYDFLHLYEESGVRLQVCGSDQWGNSIAGVDLIRRKTGGEAHVYSAPLITNKVTGQKFGKTEEGAIWLDPAKTSIYTFYQYWLNIDDEGAEEYLKVFTELDKSAIDEVLQRFHEDRGGRLAQRTLAYEVTKLVHGQEQADKVKRVSAVLFSDKNFLELTEGEVQILRDELRVTPVESTVAGTLVKAGLAASNTEAQRFIETGAISVNGQKITGDTANQFKSGSNLLKRGKNNFAIVESN
jgi:tyrosyl-tRNA synthetase